jgi:t-SNARE complex subunit (syntaxin)
MNEKFTYLFNGVSHTDVSREYMNNLGMSTEQVNSVLAQRDFELSQNLNKRLDAYRAESDPLYMEWQYDLTPESEQAWRDKVLQIKQRYPIALAD